MFRLNLIILFVFTILNFKSACANKFNNDDWFYKFSFTKQINSQLSIDCGSTDQIWIGWSHYGTRNAKTAENNLKEHSKYSVNFPNENDCWMNFTEKIAEQCNGAQQCELSSQPTYIHKCGKISDYLYVSYKCIRQADTFDICKSMSHSFTHNQFTSQNNNVYIKSSDFPTEYSASIDCSCKISSTNSHSLKMEVMWFSLQDNDFLNIFNKNLSGWINPTHEWPLISTENTIRFLTDDALAYKGFWLKLSARKQCKKDWQLVGDNCIKVFSEQSDWRSANKRCQQMNGNLLKIDDVVSDLKLTQYMKTFYPEVNSYWIGLRKYLDEFNKEKWMWSNNSTTHTTTYSDVSWWPWKDPNSNPTAASSTTNLLSSSSYTVNNCVIKHKNEDGYFTTSCDPEYKNSFICQTQSIYPTDSPANEVKLNCGPTDEVNALTSIFNPIKHISVNSIKNIIMPSTTVKTSTTTTKTPIIDSNIMVNDNFDQKNDQEMLFNLQTAKITQLITEFKKISTNLASTSAASSSSHSPATVSSAIATNNQTPSHLLNNDFKLNTTVLAGIISGIGLVIVVINLVVLFLCRRNLKNFLKSSSSSSSTSSSSSASSSSSLSTNKNIKINRDDLIQEYFEAFSTLHNKKNIKLLETGTNGCPITSGSVPLALMNTIHRLQQQQNQQSSNSSSGDESAKLFYNPKQDLLLKRHVLQQIQQDHQYDKMNHQIIHKEEDDKGLMSGDQQHYAHTYECLDHIEMPANTKARAIHLGVNGRTSSRNYRHNPPSVDLINSFNSEQTNTTNNLTDIANFNISSSSTSSSSGVSSTHQFINNSKNNKNLQQPLNFLLNSTIGNQSNSNINKFMQSQNSQQNNNINNKFLQLNNGDLINVSNIGNGTWSPDSAYYSAIPTLANYTNYNLQLQQQQQDHTQFNNQQLQQFVNSSFMNSNNINNSSSLIDAGYNSHLV